VNARRRVPLQRLRQLLHLEIGDVELLPESGVVALELLQVAHFDSPDVLWLLFEQGVECGVGGNLHSAQAGVRQAAQWFGIHILDSPRDSVNAFSAGFC
jgi:hypothetical protein